VRTLNSLVSNGFVPDAVYWSSGRTALHISASRGKKEVVEFLIQYKCNLDAADSKNRWTPLHRAVYSKRHEVVNLLAQKGANPNFQDNRGWTPLHYSSYYGFLSDTILLVDAGANSTIQNNEDRTPRDLARENNKPDIVSLLDASSLNPLRRIKDRETIPPNMPSSHQSQICKQYVVRMNTNMRDRDINLYKIIYEDSVNRSQGNSDSSRGPLVELGRNKEIQHPRSLRGSELAATLISGPTDAPVMTSDDEDPGEEHSSWIDESSTRWLHIPKNHVSIICYTSKISGITNEEQKRWVQVSLVKLPRRI
jgi:Ankyrin repeats (3 copies)/Ankyrin repeat